MVVLLHGRLFGGSFFCTRSPDRAKQDMNKQEPRGPIVMKMAVIASRSLARNLRPAMKTNKLLSWSVKENRSIVFNSTVNKLMNVEGSCININIAVDRIGKVLNI